MQIEILGEKLTQCHYVHNKSHVTYHGMEAGSPRFESGD
jgi:hypothetical protein